MMQRSRNLVLVHLRFIGIHLRFVRLHLGYALVHMRAPLQTEKEH